METQYLIYAGLGCLLFIVILLLLLACHHRTNKYELERKPSESLFSTKRGINTSGLFGVESNNKDSEELSDKDIQIIDGDNIIEFEKSLENYRDIENDPDKAFIANLCERMEYDLKEKIKQGHCVCFKVPLRTKVIRDHGPSIENSDELSLKVDDGMYKRIISPFFFFFYKKKRINKYIYINIYFIIVYNIKKQ